MRPKSLLVLFLVVLALGAFIWFFERDLPGTDERAEREQKVIALDAEEITELTIERPGTTVRLSRPPANEVEGDDETDEASRSPREWRLHEPFDVRGDGEAADRLATALVGLEKVRVIEDADPVAVGLDEPRATVSIATPDEQVSLVVGAEIPASQNMVVGRGSEVFVVAKSLWNDLSTEPGDWRSRELLPLHRGAVERVELSSQETNWTLARGEGDEFWIRAPVEDLAAKEAVDELLNSLFDGEVEGFLDAPERSLAEMGIEPASSRLAVSFVDRPEPVVLEIGVPISEEGPERYARVDGQLATLGDDLDQLLARAPSEWQSTEWTALEVFEIDAVRVTSDDGETLLERAGADWQRDGVKIAYSPVSDFLYSLTGVSGEGVLARDEVIASGLDLSSPTLRLEVKGGEGEESLALHASTAGAIAERDGRAFLLEVSLATLEELELKLAAVRDEPELVEEGATEEVSEAAEG